MTPLQILFYGRRPGARNNDSGSLEVSIREIDAGLVIAVEIS